MNLDEIVGMKEGSQAEDINMLSDPLKTMKPWVFKPKKIIYSLGNNAGQKRDFSKYHWTREENTLYIAFILKFREIIEG